MNPSNPNHDYETPVEITSTRLASFIIEKINENKADLLADIKKDLKAPVAPMATNAPLEPIWSELEAKLTPEELAVQKDIFQNDLSWHTKAMETFNTNKAEYDIKKAEYDIALAEQQRLMESMTDFSITVMKEITASGIPFPYASKCLDKVSQIVEVLKQYVTGTVSQARHEYASRSLEVRSPSNGKFTEECATVGELMLKLNDVRVAQGNDPKDYYM